MSDSPDSLLDYFLWCMHTHFKGLQDLCATKGVSELKRTVVTARIFVTAVSGEYLYESVCHISQLQFDAWTRQVHRVSDRYCESIITKEENRHFEKILSDTGRWFEYDKQRKYYFENGVMLKFQKDLSRELNANFQRGIANTREYQSTGPKSNLSDILATVLAMPIQREAKENEPFKLHVFGNKDQYVIIVEYADYVIGRLIEIQDSLTSSYRCHPDEKEKGRFCVDSYQGPIDMRFWEESAPYFTVNGDIFESNTSLGDSVRSALLTRLSKQGKFEN